LDHFYNKVKENRKSKVPENVWMELLKQQALPDRTVAHCISVGELAAQWAGEINLNNPEMIDEDVAYAGGLLHDMARHMPDHELEGAKILRGLGHDQIADVVEAHMQLPDWDGKSITEKELVYAADKVIHETDHVGIKERYRIAKEKYGHDRDTISRLDRSEKKALEVMSEIEYLIRYKSI